MPARMRCGPICRAVARSLCAPMWPSRGCDRGGCACQGELDPSHRSLGAFASQTKFIRRGLAMTPRVGAAVTGGLMHALLDPERLPSPPEGASRPPPRLPGGSGAL